MSRREIEHIILDYLKTFELQRVGIFGSFARNEQTINSDIDLLVKFKNAPSLLQLIKIENELSKKLGFKVDLITEGAVKNKRIKAQIKQDLKIIYYA
jgi:predicted nucleotidyltransferase